MIKLIAFAKHVLKEQLNHGEHGDMEYVRMAENALSGLAKPKFSIGTKYKTRGKVPRICTVIDILYTFNSLGEIVSVRYVSEHDFMGQKVLDRDVVETTIAMGFIESEG